MSQTQSRSLTLHLTLWFALASVFVLFLLGLPFAAPWVTRTPVVSLVHHVHREQWPVVFNPLVARVGWFVESRVAPRVYRGRQYVTVSGRTRDELQGLGVDPDAISVIHNGTDTPIGRIAARTAHPTIVVLGRLVPRTANQKQHSHGIKLLPGQSTETDICDYDAPTAAINWPATLPEQLATLAATLNSTPQTESQLAARFTGKGRWKSRLPDILAALEALGRARRLDDGRWLG